MPAHHPTLDQIAAARRALVAADPALTAADRQTAAFGWRSREGGFPGLFRMIVEQQVSTVSAAAVWARVEAGLGAVTPEATLAASPDALRGFGLSGQKARYAHEVARAHLEGRIDPAHLAGMADEEAIVALTAVTGVGRWTAEIYLMMCEGRTDVFPAADIALQEAIRWADGLPLRPREKETRARAEAWAPHRSVAAHLLWGWYVGVKSREIVLETGS